MSDKTNALTSAVDDFAAKAATKKQSDADFNASLLTAKNALAAAQQEIDALASGAVPPEAA